MNSYYKYKILPEFELIIQAYCGDVGFDEMIQHKFLQKKDKLFKSTYNHVVHMGAAKLDVTAESTERFIKHVLQSSYLYEYEKVAFIVSNRNQAIKGLLAQGKVHRQSHLKIDLCVSVKEAMTKLGKEDCIEQVEKEFHSLFELIDKDRDEDSKAI
jgi:hypothetical protein